MREQRNLWSGGWWRFNQYEIRDGAITPGRNATLEWYDPWEIYRRSQWNADTQPPYQSLVTLGLSLGAVFHKRLVMWQLADKRFEEGSLTFSEQTEVLHWCSRFGLLGVLPHTAVTIQLPLRFGPHVGKGLHFEREHVRVNGRWIRRMIAVCTPEVAERHRFLKKDVKLLWKNDPTLGRLVRKSDRNYRVPTVFFQKQRGLTADRDESLPLAHILHRFFPEFQDEGYQFECPLPLTPEFWKIYSERVEDFIKHAVAFLTAVEPVLSRRPRTDLAPLECLIEPVGTSLSFASNGDVQEQWVCPSLLSSFARMALQDTWAGMRILRCDCCGKPFVTSRYQSLYCSEACGWRHRKRRAALKKSKKQL
jgi:hypothetical protein